MKSQQGRRNGNDYSNQNDRDENGRFNGHRESSNSGPRHAENQYGPSDYGQGYRSQSSRDWNRSNSDHSGSGNGNRGNSGYWGSGDEGQSFGNQGHSARDWNRENSGYNGNLGYGDYQQEYGSRNEWSGNTGGYFGTGNLGSGTYGQGSRNSDDYPRRNSQGQFAGAYDSDYNRGDDRDRQSSRRSTDYGDTIDNSGTSQWMNREHQGESHRGKGPKGYKRTDERITEDVNQKLSDDHDVDASEIEVSVSNGEVTLTGTVDSREAKRKAEDVAEGVSGVSNVENRIKIERGSTKHDMSDSLSSNSGESTKEKSKSRNHHATV